MHKYTIKENVCQAYSGFQQGKVHKYTRRQNDIGNMHNPTETVQQNYIIAEVQKKEKKKINLTAKKEKIRF